MEATQSIASEDAREYCGAGSGASGVVSIVAKGVSAPFS